MKAFFHRLYGSKDKESPKEIKQPPPDTPTSRSATPLAASPYIESKPLPDPVPDSTGRSSRKTDASDVQKKVAFVPETERAASPANGPIKTTLSRFQATNVPRASTSSAGASSSKTDLPARTASPYLNKPDNSAQSLRSGTPYSQMSQNTSGSRILAAQSWSEVTEEDLVSNLGSRERTRQEVLFEIISSEERYVQELVKMRETFIDPLLHPFSSRSNDEYYRVESPLESTDHLPPIAARFMSPTPTNNHPPTAATDPANRNKYTPTPIIDGESLDTDDDDDPDQRPLNSKRPQGATSPTSKLNHPRSPYRAAVTKNLSGKPTVPFPSRSHHSLPPPPRPNNASTHSLGRTSTITERERNYSQGQASLAAERKAPKPTMLRKLKKSEANGDLFGDAVAPHQLPEDLRICLEVIDSGVLEGHKRLCEALKKRYDDQYPLVRSLADVFVSHANIFNGYATYVLHLERCLEQVDDALHNVTTKKPKKQDLADWNKVCKILKRLEESASEKGETGLAITLSKPFQRLLKYPLLFQNLLFHTDPSTFEYESTLQMVAEVETIVRSIEDEKIQKEERDKTRDVFARIEGLDKVRQLALPKPSRVLVEERQCPPSIGGAAGLKTASPPPAMSNRGVKGKSSFKRLSDVLGNSSNKKDLWFVVFNDVVLQCQRTGTTSLPLVATTNSRTTSMPDLQGKAKYASTGRRNSHTKPRNLYKFVKIETWAIGDVVKPREGVVSMEDVVKSRQQAHAQPRIVPLPDDDEDNGAESDDSDKKSKMSFSYWGADKVTVQKPIIKGGRLAVTPRRGGHGASYGRESSANAKFGSRLVSGDQPAAPVAGRPASRRTAPTPTSRRAEEVPNYAKATVTRPDWNTSTRPPLATTPVPGKRVRNISQTSRPTVASTGKEKGLSSPAPSEDSGVGLYRQMLANDPSLNRL